MKRILAWVNDLPDRNDTAKRIWRIYLIGFGIAMVTVYGVMGIGAILAITGQIYLDVSITQRVLVVVATILLSVIVAYALTGERWKKLW